MKRTAREPLNPKPEVGGRSTQAARPAVKLRPATGSGAWHPRSNRGHTKQTCTFAPALHLHSCHPWVFQLKSRCVTSSNLPPVAGKGEESAARRLWSQPTFTRQSRAAESGPCKAKIWNMERQWFVGRHEVHTVGCSVSQNVLFGKMTLGTVAALCI